MSMQCNCVLPAHGLEKTLKKYNAISDSYRLDVA